MDEMKIVSKFTTNMISKLVKMVLRKKEKHLSSKIRIFEDMLLRSKNAYEIETLRNELAKMRISLQKLQYERVLTRALSFCA